MSATATELELDLRMLPGVLNVAIESSEGSPDFRVTVVALDAPVGIDELAGRTTRSYSSTATTEIVQLSQPSRHPGAIEPANRQEDRVTLVRCAVHDDRTTSVTLSWLGDSTTTSVPDATLWGSPTATLAALDELGFNMRGECVSISTARGIDNPPVRVILHARGEPDEYVGIARGRNPYESAARATLAAFNRFTADKQ